MPYKDKHKRKNYKKDNKKMNNLSALRGVQTLINNTAPTGVFVSNNAHDIRTACETGFWDTDVKPHNTTGLFQIVGTKPIRDSIDTGGVLTFQIEEGETGGNFSDRRWYDPLKTWRSRLYFKCNGAGFPLIEYRTNLNELEVNVYGQSASKGMQCGFVYVNRN